MQYKINLLTQTVNELEKLPVDELQKENEILKSENADLEEQVKFINENYERHQEEKLKIENYLADLEETIEEKEKVHKNFYPICPTSMCTILFTFKRTHENLFLIHFRVKHFSGRL